MVGKSHIHSDESLLSRLDRLLYAIESFMTLLGGFAILALILLAVVSVTGRNLWGQPLLGYVDWVEQSMPLIAFLGISYAQRNGAHVRMDMFIARLTRRSLYVTEFFTSLCILLLVVCLTWGSWSHFLRSLDFNAPLWSRDSSMDIAIPLWPAKMVVSLAFFVLTLRLVLQLWGFARAFFMTKTTHDHHPVAIPLVQDIVTQAKAESETASS